MCLAVHFGAGRCSVGAVSAAKLVRDHKYGDKLLVCKGDEDDIIHHE
jgi:hypothetical protein